MVLYGYHYTLETNWESIGDNGFSRSEDFGHWLGDGFYFYPSYEEAHQAKAVNDIVIKVKIEVAEERFLDFSSQQGRETCESIVSTIEKRTRSTVHENRMEVARKELVYNVNKTNIRNDFDVFKGRYYNDDPTLKDDNINNPNLKYEVHILVRNPECITYFKIANG
jgi:hypothetical protein